MRIDWTQTAAGIDITGIRSVLVRAASSKGTITLASIASVHPATKRPGQGRRPSINQPATVVEAARCLLQVLVASDMIEATDWTGRTEDPLVYRLTPTAYGLMNASKLERIPRTKALQAVKELSAAAEAINADPAMLHDVVELAIYGSVLTDSADLGDVNVACRINVRESLDWKAFEAAHPEPYAFSVGHSRHYWPLTVTKRRLQVRRCIRLSDMRIVAPSGCPMRTLLPEVRDVAPSPEWSPIQTRVVLRDDGGRALEVLDNAIHERDAERRRESAEFRRACLSGNPPEGADPKRIVMTLRTAGI